MMFLARTWDAPMNYAEHSLDEARTIVDSFNSFFKSVRSVLNNATPEDAQRWNNGEKKLSNLLRESQIVIDKALRSNFDTRTALRTIQNVVKETSKYISSTREPRALLLTTVEGYVSKILQSFGLGDPPSGWGSGGGASVDGTAVSREKLVGPF